MIRRIKSDIVSRMREVSFPDQEGDMTMATSRKDPKGRVLRRGESYRPIDNRYSYNYTDPFGRRKTIYDRDLAKLREKIDVLRRDQLDGLDVYVAGVATVNDVFDRYISMKYNLRHTTKTNYIYMYDRFVRESFGKRRIAEVKYSDVKWFYYQLLNERHIQANTLDTIHCVLHPTFQLAVRDDIIRKNPTEGVMAEIKKSFGKNKGVRHALTIDQQRAFMNYVANHPVYYHWWPVFTVLLGTGCRVGEFVGLRWEDIDIEKRTISINHSLVYDSRRVGDSDYTTQCLSVSKPKTEAGVRIIPMIDSVKDAFEMVREEQEETGFNETVIDGMSGFIFKNRYGNVLHQQSINKAIQRISSDYNYEEELKAKREKREPLILPHFSCHHLRHTFCTRFCENETNLKVIQSIMGHANIETTMDIYAEATESKNQQAMKNLSEKLDVF